VLHKRYDRVRAIVDRRFVHYRRRCRADGLTLERIELWHDLLEAGLAADSASPEPGEGWEEHILSKVEDRYQEIRSSSFGE
jgi:hypothetical protein